MEDVKVVPTLPRRRSGVTEASAQWDPYALKAKEVYPNSVQVAEGVEEEFGKRLRRRRRDPYYTTEGHIKVSVLNTSVGKDGIRRGDVYFTWVPYKKKGK